MACEKAAVRQRGQEAVLLMTKGRFKEAEPVLREALAQTREQNNAETFMWTQRLAECLIGQGNCREAEPLAQKAHNGFRRFGQEDEDVLDCKYLMAECLYGQRKNSDAADIAQSLLEALMRNSMRGEEHPTTLKCRGLLASSLKNQGKVSQARELAKENQDMLEAVLAKAEVIESQGSRRLALIERQAFQTVENFSVKVLGEEKCKPKRTQTIESESTGVPDSDYGGSRLSSRAPSKSASVQP